MKQTIFTSLAILALQMFVFGQTNVGGGIYSNTTWTLANSPYIVTDTIVVFPGVILTIEPGVTVKFNNNKVLIVRQGQLIALGTNSNQIVFTSNLNNPTMGSWDKIHINGGTLISQFDYCKIEYAKVGIYNNHLSGTTNTTATLNITNTEFSNNIQGLYIIGNGGGVTTLNNSSLRLNQHGIDGSQFVLNNCTISNNQTGVGIGPAANTFTRISGSQVIANRFGISGTLGGVMTGASFFSVKNSIISCNTEVGIVLGQYASYIDTVYNCLFENNLTAILDSSYVGGGLRIEKSIFQNNNVGLRLKNSNKQILCNKFCNTMWDIYCAKSFSSNLTASNNYWCTNNPTVIGNKIHDGYDDFNLSLVNFSPIDTVQCYSLGVTNPISTSNCGCNLNAPSIIQYQNYLFSDTTYSFPTGGALSYQWFINGTAINGATSQIYITTQSGNYTVEITNGNCSATSASVFHCNPTIPSITRIGDTLISPNVISYRWIANSGGTVLSTNQEFVPSQDGWYILETIDSDGCIASTPPYLFVATTPINPSPICTAYYTIYPDSSLAHTWNAYNLSSSSNPLVYTWYWGDGDSSVGIAPSHTYSTPGYYNICLYVSDGLGCDDWYCDSSTYIFKTDGMITINVFNRTHISSVISETKNSDLLNVYPNPSNGIFILSSDDIQNSEVEVFSISGKKVFFVKGISGKTVSIDISGQAKGIYFFKVTNSNNSWIQRVVLR